MKFWDTSAMAATMLGEPVGARLRALLEADMNPVVWWGTSVECAAALARAGRDGRLAGEGVQRGVAALRELESRWTEVPPSESVRATAERLVQRHPLRAADAFQLAAALEWADQRPTPAHGFVTLDHRLGAIAAREGFGLAIETPPPAPAAG
ncbi:MAG: type II toxin-antitoxin system VapC family toxin [Gemmatimonadales bacterium]